MAKVYLETSFFSACGWDRPHPVHVAWKIESLRWWVRQRAYHQLFLSAEVLRELSAEGFRHRDEALSMVQDVGLLPVNVDVQGLAQILVREKVMPGPGDAGDAIHVAAATAHQVEFLLTWNQQHLANRNKLPHLREVCRRAGFVPPEIITPPMLWKDIEETS